MPLNMNCRPTVIVCIGSNLIDRNQAVQFAEQLASAGGVQEFLRMSAANQKAVVRPAGRGRVIQPAQKLAVTRHEYNALH